MFYFKRAVETKIVSTLSLMLPCQDAFIIWMPYMDAVIMFSWIS